MIFEPSLCLTMLQPMIEATIEKPPSTSGYSTACISAPFTISAPSSMVAISVTA